MKNEVFGMSSSTSCHVIAIGNTMCTTWVLLWLSLDLLISGVGIKTLTIKLLYGTCTVCCGCYCGQLYKKYTESKCYVLAL